jgi:hypothetical protein
VIQDSTGCRWLRQFPKFCTWKGSRLLVTKWLPNYQFRGKILGRAALNKKKLAAFPTSGGITSAA